ncbi:MAG: GNAT family N-acetyltransferase [Candidatus Heimdallarchaeota archaeon]|nr:GNAT family N-acetyltransferase [Candidatus Heimdallarchaeota archaeon]
MEFRKLKRDEIVKVHEINRTETIDGIYYFREGRLELEDEDFDVPEWTVEKKDSFVIDIQKLFDRGGSVFGAFENDTLVGMSTIDNRFLGEEYDLMNLSHLWVSDGYRKKGVASTLIDRVIEVAKSKGAKGLYVSATESKNTVHFYMNRGFNLTKPDKILYEKEPKDIHMAMRF